MHEGLVRQVHQVVDDETVVALHLDQLAIGSPIRVLVPMHVGDERGIGQCWIARPDPDEAVLLSDRVGLHTGGRIDGVLRGHVYTAPGLIEFETVIAADDIITFEPPERQRHQPMPTGIGKSDGRAILLAIQNNRLVTDGARQELAL